MTTDHDLTPAPALMTPITITIRKDGPYSIVGDDVANVRLVDADGNVVQPRNPAKLSLCRCGASSTKPFCDGTHSKIGFKGAEEAAKQFDAQNPTPSN